MNPTLLTPISVEFQEVELGDRRLNQRLLSIAEASDRAPGRSFPEQAVSSAALEATYRFFGNAHVDAESVFEGHVNATCARAQEEEVVYVVHDTTEFRFGGEKPREGLGWISTHYWDGFLAHYSLCVSKDGKPLGSLGLYAWARQGKKKGRGPHPLTQNDPNRESLRWQEAALLTGRLLHKKTNAIHVMDREADAIELFSVLLEHDQRFVIRIGHNRRREPGRGKPRTKKLFEKLSSAPVFLQREVVLSARGKPSGSNKQSVFPARRSRVASLEIRAERQTIFSAHTAPAHVPHKLTLNFVEIHEIDPPEGEAPILWRLVTTESIETPEDVALVVDAYRRRWLIEEFFKALKTGCRYQQRQLESARALMTALAIESAVAWRMLLMRHLMHQEPDAEATDILPQDQLSLLVALLENDDILPQAPTVKEALLGVAKLGGHIKNNGPPGWLILRRGLDKLLSIHRGWALAQAAIAQKM